MTMIGIDLGTTNSCVAFHDGISPQVIEASSGTATMPSAVGFDPSGKMVVGHFALKAVRRNERYVFTEIKREIGRTFVEGEDYGPQIVPGPDGKRAFAGPDRAYSPQELSAEILKVLKARAEDRLGKKVTGVVITVPAGFDPHRVTATEEAAKMAGFRKVQSLTEPEAAVLAYQMNRTKFSRVVVFDLGGGTFDVVVAKVGNGAYQPLAKSGFDQLGGTDYDRQIFNYVSDQYKAEKGQDLRDKPMSVLKLKPEVEAAKKDLTEVDLATVECINGAFNPEEGIMGDVRCDVSVETFDALTAELTKQAMEITKRVMSDAKLTPRDIDDVLLVGGMTRVRSVRKALEDFFGEKKLRDHVNPDLAVAVGAATKAAEIEGRIAERTVVEDITAMAFGIEVEGNRFVQFLPKGVPYGSMESKILTAARDGQASLPIAIIQGDDPKANNNTVLTELVLEITPGPAGSQSIQLDMMVDESGKPLATWKDLDTGASGEVLGQ